MGCWLDEADAQWRVTGTGLNSFTSRASSPRSARLPCTVRGGANETRCDSQLCSTRRKTHALSSLFLFCPALRHPYHVLFGLPLRCVMLCKCPSCKPRRNRTCPGRGAVPPQNASMAKAIEEGTCTQVGNLPAMTARRMSTTSASCNLGSGAASWQRLVLAASVQVNALWN